jgi:DNA invertase Pin-like site-specific DNA recombinase
MATRDLTREAIARKRQAGQRIGTVPFGKVLADDGQTLMDDATEVRVISRIVQMRKHGMTLREICDRLNADGIATKKRKGKWQHTTVWRIIRSA